MEEAGLLEDLSGISFQDLMNFTPLFTGRILIYPIGRLNRDTGFYLSQKVISYKNQFIFVWENATDLDLQFLHIIWLPYHFVKAFLRRDWASFLGFFKAFILLPKIIQSSFKAQKMFVKTDYEVIKEFE